MKMLELWRSLNQRMIKGYYEGLLIDLALEKLPLLNESIKGSNKCKLLSHNHDFTYLMGVTWQVLQMY